MSLPDVPRYVVESFSYNLRISRDLNYMAELQNGLRITTLALEALYDGPEVTALFSI